MSKSVQDYVNLITSQFQGQPNYVAMVSFSVAIQAQIQALLSSMEVEGGIFDLSTPPVGNQLDIIGQWVGVSRYLEVPVAGVFFTWDGSSSQGWDSGVWQSPLNDEVLTVLPDDVYLTVVLAKIAANNWDGTTEGAYAIWALLFPTLNILIQDGEDMSFIMAVQGTVLDALTLALLTSGLLPLRPEGVLISEYIVPVNTGPLFAWDVSNSFLSGWDSGSWGIELPAT